MKNKKMATFGLVIVAVVSTVWIKWMKSVKTPNSIITSVTPSSEEVRIRFSPQPVFFKTK